MKKFFVKYLAYILLPILNTGTLTFFTENFQNYAR